MENKFIQASVKIHHTGKEKKQKTEREKLNTKESFSEDGLESYELKRYLELKKEIIDVKKDISYKIIFFGLFTFVFLAITMFNVIKKTNMEDSAQNGKIQTMTLHNQIKNNFELLNKQLKIIAENQKILNNKVIAVYNMETQTMKKINADIKDIDTNIRGIYDYLKTEGKIMEVLSQIIMNDSVKLDKIVDKIYQPEIKTESRSANNVKKTGSLIKTSEKVKKEIKEETDNLINKYKNLLKELQ